MKPKPLSRLNHLTVPVISTAVDGSGPRRGPRGPRPPDRGGAAAAVLSSISTTLVTWAPLGALAVSGCAASAPGRYRVAADRLELADMQEGIARTVGQFGEAEAFLGVEPLYRGIDDRTLAALSPAKGRDGRGALTGGS